MEILKIKLFVKIAKLVIIVFILVFLVSMIWMLVAQLEPIFIDKDSDFWKDTDHFFTSYSILMNTPYRIMLVGLYTSITTLSTVGLGDVHPKSSYERILTAITMVAGVSVFSYIMGKFLEVVEDIKDFDVPTEDHDGLTNFFGVLQKLNDNQQINEATQTRI